MERLWRRWAKRIAIALAVFVGLNVVVVGASFVSGALAAPELPVLPEAPAIAVPAIELSDPPQTEAPVAESPVVEAPLAAASASATVPGEFLVAVGLFSSGERADQLVDALTQAGLPAMQRPVQLRRQQLHQIVLGPFFSRADAVAGLQRLQALGGYGDAKVIAGS
jgi:cell division septation protein DedD